MFIAARFESFEAKIVILLLYRCKPFPVNLMCWESHVKLLTLGCLAVGSGGIGWFHFWPGGTLLPEAKAWLHVSLTHDRATYSIFLSHPYLSPCRTL